MAIKMIDNKHWTGLSTDTKPVSATNSGVELLDIFTETDTGIDYITYDGTNWVVYEHDQLTEAQINAQVDLALNTAIPASNTLNSINDVLLDQLVPAVNDINTDLGESADTHTASTVFGVLDLLKDNIASIPTTMRGTDNAALASVLGALNDATAADAPTDVDTAMAYLKQLVTLLLLVPTTAMRGTDNAALASVLGALDTSGATGAVGTDKVAMAYLKQLVTASIALEKETEYVEEHLHHKVHWYGKAADQTTNWCDGATLTSFRATSGDNAWGTAGNDPAKCFSTADTLSELGTGLVCGDFDMILVTANSSGNLYKLRLVWGTGTLAEAITAGQFTELVYSRATGDTTRIPRAFGCPKIGIANAVWVVIWSATNDATLDFMLGVHAYNF
jgi:hypothetical protein